MTKEKLRGLIRLDKSDLIVFWFILLPMSLTVWTLIVIGWIYIIKDIL